MNYFKLSPGLLLLIIANIALSLNADKLNDNGSSFKRDSVTEFTNNNIKFKHGIERTEGEKLNINIDDSRSLQLNETFINLQDVGKEHQQAFSRPEEVPQADFSANQTQFTGAGRVRFYDLSTGRPDSWQWSFPGAYPESSEEQHPEVAYLNPGTYTVTLTASNNLGSDTETKTAFIEVLDYNPEVLPPVADFVAPAFFDGFEHYPSFALSFSPWTLIDGDGSPTYGIQDVDFPNSGYTGSFIIFNPAYTDPPLTGIWEPRSGDKYAACFAARDVPNDDWLISPKIQLGENSTLTIWVKSVTDEYGLERFNIGISNTGNSIEDFSIISESPYEEAPVEWTMFEYNIQDYDNQEVYIAINCVSDDAFVFMVDDIIVKTDDAVINIFEGEFASIVDFSDGSPHVWAWDLPGAITNYSIDQHTTQQYNSAGSYDVTLTAANEGGKNTITKSGFVNVEGREPLASFFAGNYNGFTNDFFQPFIPKNETVDFFDASKYMPNSWSWTFRSGTPSSSNLQNPQQINYNKQGRFDVSLNAQNSYGSDVLYLERYINVGCCDYITNILPGDGLTYYGLAVDGFLPGHNQYEFTAYAEKFTSEHAGYLYALDLLVVFADGNSDVVVSVWDEVDNKPGTLLGSKTMNISEFNTLEWNVIIFDDPIAVSGNFYVGYQISYDDPHDFDNHMFLVAMMQDRGPDKPESMYVFYDEFNNWYNVNWLFSGLASALAAIPYYCYDGTEFMIYNIEAESGNNGSLVPEGNIEVPQGESQSFIIESDEGYHVNEVFVNGQSIGAVESYTFEQVWDDHSIYASFEINTYEIRVIAGNGGSIDPGENLIVEYGETVVFDIIPDEGFEINDVEIDGESIGVAEQYTFENISNDHRIEAFFSQKTFTISASSANNGSIMPEGEVDVNYGSNPPFHILPDDGYYIGNVLVDGQSEGPLSSYQFFNVTDNHSIHSVFAPALIDGDANGDGRVDILDLIWLIRHVNNDIPDGFLFVNADINNDNVINMVDLNLLINIIMDNSGKESGKTGYNSFNYDFFENYNDSGPAYSGYSITNESAEYPYSLTLKNDTIYLNSDGKITALHFKLKNSSAENIKAEMISPGFTIACNANQDVLSCVIYNLSLTPFPEGEISIVTVKGLCIDDKTSWKKIDAADVNHNSIKLSGKIK